MFQIGDIVWSIIYYFDRPKKTTIKNIIITDAIPKEYIVTYDNRDYIIRNENIYPTQMDADIYIPLPKNPILQVGDAEARNHFI